MLNIDQIKKPILRQIFLKNGKKMMEELKKIKEVASEKDFNYELTMAFWFAVHLEDLELASILVDSSILLKQLVICALNSESRKGSQRGGNTESMYRNMSTLRKGTIKGSTKLEMMGKFNSELQQDR
mmetsp:Transcript_23322/g.22953  ORF Transcript_23322/g.22953 Transcript_23322/m.22953 type:complete len:127 (+) Transcript_23322:155-535(+)